MKARDVANERIRLEKKKRDAEHDFIMHVVSLEEVSKSMSRPRRFFWQKRKCPDCGASVSREQVGLYALHTCTAKCGYEWVTIGGISEVP